MLQGNDPELVPWRDLSAYVETIMAKINDRTGSALD